MLRSWIILLALPTAVVAETPDQLARNYTRFAGSEANAESLVRGLRNGETIVLEEDGRATFFTPKTGKMSNGNVKLALNLAQRSLAEHGVLEPTPEQIHAALNGGTITTRTGERITLDGVLALRAGGLGWGRIARLQGVRLGEVTRPQVHRARLERPERPQKIERPERPERPERHHRR